MVTNRGERTRSTFGGSAMRKQKEPAPWVPSWKHHGWQGLKEFGERQAARMASVKQRRVKVA